jgi:hypothetical protein
MTEHSEPEHPAETVWVLIDRDNYPFAAFDTEAAARARADEIATARRARCGDRIFKAEVPDERRQEYFAPAVCSLELNKPGDP